ncbi:MAG: PIN domain-containing protein [Geothrix sp.]|nr:PIN domain-containing protein [Geothrix sp.]
MKLLLDTHIFLWLNTDDPKLTKKARSLLDEAQEIFISSVVFWELALKISRGDLTADLVLGLRLLESDLPKLGESELQVGGF